MKEFHQQLINDIASKTCYWEMLTIIQMCACSSTLSFSFLPTDTRLNFYFFKRNYGKDEGKEEKSCKMCKMRSHELIIFVK